MQTNETDARSRPFLSRYSVPRTAGPDIGGHYSEEARMWVIDTLEGNQPIISASNSLAELLTKTHVVQESDDELKPGFLDITTKTDANTPEADDQTKYGSAMLELSTKTEAELERDDTSPTSSIFF